jgi:hypothetical protein
MSIIHLELNIQMLDLWTPVRMNDIRTVRFYLYSFSCICQWMCNVLVTINL